MRIEFHKDFTKLYKKLPRKLQLQTQVRVELFATDPDNEQLRRHALKGEFSDYWSINISGDCRALYEDYGDYVLFIKIGSHSELYG
jgi:addiction module RelE/StbE family toxin